MVFPPTSRPASSVPQSGSGKRGFALLITITLLAFLVLLLVSLASLTRVETQVAGNSQNLAQARQNALMALNIALGQLQKFAGPDQRVTGTADLAGNAAGGRISSNSSPAIGPGKVQSGTRYWTGVWGNSFPSAPTVGNSNSYEKTPTPVLLNWLVSGNENATFTSSTTAATFGQVAAGTAPARVPADALAGSGLNTINSTAALLTAIDPANASPIKVGGVDAMILVGPITAGIAPRSVENIVNPATGAVTAGQTENFYDRYVVAPLQTITAPAGSVPGLGAAATPQVGRFAWWVGDEGVKACINLADRYAANTDATTDPLARARLFTAPRTGAEVVKDRAGPNPMLDFGTSPTAANYLGWSQTAGTAKNVIKLPQFSMLDSTNLVAATVGRHVHDFTAFSEGIEADSYNGGLRRDLTYYFEQATLPTWTGTNGAAAGTGTSIIPTAYSPNYNGTAHVPQWDVLRDFYHLYNDNQVAGAVPAQAASLTKTGFAPELLQLRILVGANATNGQMVKGLFTPLIALGNPYSTPLKLNGLKVQFWLADAYASETWPHQVDRMSSLAVAPDLTFNTGRFMKLLTYESDSANGFGSLTGAVTFTLPTVTLQPGEAKLFSLNNNYDAAAGIPVPLVAGVASDFAGTYHYVYRTSTLASPATGSGVQYYKFNESDIMTPMVMKILDSSSPAQTVLRIEGLNIDAGTTNSYGSYKEPNGATNTDRIIVAYNFDFGDPGVSPTLADPALRAYADFNPRAAVTRLTNAASISGAYFRYSPNTGDLATANTITPSVPPTTFTSNLDPIEWGRHGQDLSPVLYNLPQGSVPVLSIGQLQQANLTADDIALNVGHQPALPVGNSYASPFLIRNLTVQARTDTYNSRWTGAPAYTATRNYYDISYLLNTALWDGYFFSTISQTGATFTPVSPRLSLSSGTVATQARDGAQAASVTTIDGAFNINSTSVDAWTALLAGMRNLPSLAATGATANTGVTVFPRSLWQPTDARTAAGATSPTLASGDKADAYSGFRRLTDTQIVALATAIVKQVRLRGPFLSLSQFVNRALITATTDTSGLGYAGALQTAIDGTTSTTTTTSGGVTTTTAQEDTTTIINNFADISVNADKLTIPASHTYYAEPVATDFAANAARVPQRSTGIPGWLTQADVLQAVGSVLSARSDTFLIRTYGDVKNPVTGVITGRAWCEATVQRLPEYVDAAVTPAWTAPSAASIINQTFGRRFKIVSFRWLGPNDI